MKRWANRLILAVAAGCSLYTLYFVARHWRWTGFSTQFVVISTLGVALFFLMRIANRQERERVAALFAERLIAIAAADIGLAPSDSVLPPAVASSKALRDDGDVIGRPLRGTWEGGELLVIDHSYLTEKSDGDDGNEEVRDYRTVYAFRLPDNSQGYLPSAPWSAQTVGDWLVLYRAGRETPLTTAELSAQLEQARVFARRTLL